MGGLGASGVQGRSLWGDEISANEQTFCIDPLDKFGEILSGRRDTRVWSLEAAILDFSTFGLGAEYPHKFQCIAGPQKYRFSGISYIFAFEVLRPPKWTIHFRFGCTASALFPLDWWITQTHVAVGILLTSRLQAELAWGQAGPKMCAKNGSSWGSN